MSTKQDITAYNIHHVYNLYGRVGVNKNILIYPRTVYQTRYNLQQIYNIIINDNQDYILYGDNDVYSDK